MLNKTWSNYTILYEAYCQKSNPNRLSVNLVFHSTRLDLRWVRLKLSNMIKLFHLQEDLPKPVKFVVKT